MIVYIDDKRRQFAQIVTKIQHAVAGFPLLGIAIHNLSEGHEIPIAVVEAVIAVLVLGTFFLELRAMVRHSKHGTHAHPKVGWFDLAAGVLLIYEAFHGAHHKPGYMRPQFMSGVVTIALGVLHARLSRFGASRRYFKIDDAGIEYRMNFRGWSIPWSELKSIDLGDKKVLFTRKNGEHHALNLGRLHNHAAVREAIAEHPELAKLTEPRP